jgi:hypothetical protein
MSIVQEERMGLSQPPLVVWKVPRRSSSSLVIPLDYAAYIERSHHDFMPYSFVIFSAMTFVGEIYCPRNSFILERAVVVFSFTLSLDLAM